MCGIIGIISNTNTLKESLSILKKLEYRGYDSSGLVGFYENKYRIYRSMGHVKELENKIDFSELFTTCIAHTRWATHGKPTVNNTHPHYSYNKRFYLVHNGTIENYKELKKNFLSNINMYGETDTEVLVNYISFLVEKENMTLVEALSVLNKNLKGSAAICLIDKENTDRIYFYKNKSPLILGMAKNSKYLCSDINAISNLCSTYYSLDSGDYGYIDNNNILIFNKNNIKIDKKEMSTNWLEKNTYNKGNFEHYMLKEIHEQPKVIRKIVEKYIENNKFTYDIKPIEAIKNAEKLIFISSGTSYHSSLILEQIIQTQLKKDVSVYISSEFAYSDIQLNNKYVYIFISQSGETADSLAALSRVKKNSSATTISVTNVFGSNLSMKSDFNFNIYAGVEVAVASTKAYISQIATFMGVILYASGYSAIEFKNKLLKTADIIENIISKKDLFLKIAKDLKDHNKVFYLGRQQGYPMALEGALKLKEITYIQSEGFASGELKHGSIALIEEGTPVISIITNKNSVSNMIRSNIEEVKSRGANIITITEKKNSIISDSIIIEDIDELFNSLTLSVPLQLIAYYTSKLKKLNVDMPRNLAKSVTVE